MPKDNRKTQKAAEGRAVRAERAAAESTIADDDPRLDEALANLDEVSDEELIEAGLPADFRTFSVDEQKPLLKAALERVLANEDDGFDGFEEPSEETPDEDSSDELVADPAPEGTEITPENAGIVVDAEGTKHVGELPAEVVAEPEATEAPEVPADEQPAVDDAAVENTPVEDIPTIAEEPDAEPLEVPEAVPEDPTESEPAPVVEETPVDEAPADVEEVPLESAAGEPVAVPEPDES